MIDIIKGSPIKRFIPYTRGEDKKLVVSLSKQGRVGN